jgi:hypothetical protein
MVEMEFKSVYPGDAVQSVELIADQGDLLPFVEEYEGMKRNLEDYLDELKFRISQGLEVSRKKVRGAPEALCRVRVHPPLFPVLMHETFHLPAV